MSRCPNCTRTLINGNVKGYYQCNKCKKFYYISETNFPIITPGMPLNAKVRTIVTPFKRGKKK